MQYRIYQGFQGPVLEITGLRCGSQLIDRLAFTPISRFAGEQVPNLISSDYREPNGLMMGFQEFVNRMVLAGWRYIASSTIHMGLVVPCVRDGRIIPLMQEIVSGSRTIIHA